MKFFFRYIIFLMVFLSLNGIKTQSGPDPWDSGKDESHMRNLKKKSSHEKNGCAGIGEWSFKRMIAILIKNQMKNHDGTIDVNIQMKFSPERWHALEEYLKPDVTFSEDMFRRTLGYVEEAIYKPILMETMKMAWSDYVQVYITEYKVHITWILGIISAICVMNWLYSRMSQRHIIIVIIVLLYIYEVAISYKEAEQQELQKFISAVNTCKWYFWTHECDVPSPDLLIFMKHMNPGKIAIRMFTNWISEPIICISATIKTIIHGVTDGLWFPIDVIIYGILTVGINVMLIILMIMVIFNYIFNIPFNLGFLFFNVGILQRNKTNPCTTRNNDSHGLADSNRIAGATLDRFLEICSHAVQTANVNRHRHPAPLPAANNLPTIKRSASTGRLPNLAAVEYETFRQSSNHVRQRRNINIDGSGDS